MPEVIRLRIKPYGFHMSGVRPHPSLVEGWVSQPEWTGGQERELDSQIYSTLQECGISTYRIYIAHEFEHDTGAQGLEAWELIVELAGAVAAGAAGGLATLLVQQVLPRFIRILRPKPLRGGQDTITLVEARDRAAEHLRAALMSAGTTNPQISETLSTTVEDGHYLFNFEVGEMSYKVLVGKNGGVVFMMRELL